MAALAWCGEALVCPEVNPIHINLEKPNRIIQLIDNITRGSIQTMPYLLNTGIHLKGTTIIIQLQLKISMSI
jgi:hypothetical protein